MQAVFTTNESEFARLEGLYVRERKPPAAISGVFLGVIGIVSQCVRGPANVVVEGDAVRLAEIFGNGSDLRTALLNKPFGRLAVVRAVATDSVVATKNAATVVDAVQATGQVTCVTKAAATDGHIITIGDGLHSARVFEIDKAGDGVTGGRIAVNISADTTAADVAVTLLAAFAAAKVAGFFDITATLNADPTKIDLVRDLGGTGGNVAITTNSAFTVSGMSGGVAATSADVVQIDANGAGAWANDLTYTIADASDGDADHWNLTIKYLTRAKVYRNLDTSVDANNIALVIGDDKANLVVVTKLNDGRPTNVTDASLDDTAGDDGTINDSDYTATGKAIDKLADYSRTRLGYRFVAERTSDALNTKIYAMALAANFGFWGMCPTAETVSAEDAATDAADYRSDRVIYTFNGVYTVDPDTNTSTLTMPTAWIGSVFSQIDVDIHPGEEDTKPILGRIQSLYNESLSRESYISLREGGVCALEHDGGFAFVSGVTTAAPDGSGVEQITRRRMTDYLQHSIADFLRPSVKKKNTPTRRKANIGAIKSFLKRHAEAERVVDGPEGEGYSVVGDTDAGNTTDTRAAGQERILTRVSLVKHNLAIVLDTEIGTTVVITARAA